MNKKHICGLIIGIITIIPMIILNHKINKLDEELSETYEDLANEICEVSNESTDNLWYIKERFKDYPTKYDLINLINK